MSVRGGGEGAGGEGVSVRGGGACVSVRGMDPGGRIAPHAVAAVAVVAAAGQGFSAKLRRYSPLPLLLPLLPLWFAAAATAATAVPPQSTSAPTC